MKNLETIDLANLESVSGGQGIGINRETWVGGGQVAGAVGGAVGGGAAGGYVSGGNPHVARGAAALGGKAGSWLGGKVGGAIWDAGTAIGDRVGRWIYGN